MLPHGQMGFSQNRGGEPPKDETKMWVSQLPCETTQKRVPLKMQNSNPEVRFPFAENPGLCFWGASGETAGKFQSTQLGAL